MAGREYYSGYKSAFEYYSTNNAESNKNISFSVKILYNIIAKIN
jgi:hypothetical protein